MKKHVAVLMGGWSSERPVSLNSGKQCADALEAALDIFREQGLDAMMATASALQDSIRAL